MHHVSLEILVISRLHLRSLQLVECPNDLDQFFIGLSLRPSPSIPYHPTTVALFARFFPLKKCVHRRRCFSSYACNIKALPFEKRVLGNMVRSNASRRNSCRKLNSRESCARWTNRKLPNFSIKKHESFEVEAR